MLWADARRVAIGAEEAAGLECRERAAIAVLADAVEDDVKAAGKNTREVFALVVNGRCAKLADQGRVRAAPGAPQLDAGRFAERQQRLTNGACGSVHEHALPSP